MGAEPEKKNRWASVDGVATLAALGIGILAIFNFFTSLPVPWKILISIGIILAVYVFRVFIDKLFDAVDILGRAIRKIDEMSEKVRDIPRIIEGIDGINRSSAMQIKSRPVLVSLVEKDKDVILSIQIHDGGTGWERIKLISGERGNAVGQFILLSQSGKNLVYKLIDTYDKEFFSPSLEGKDISSMLVYPVEA